MNVLNEKNPRSSNLKNVLIPFPPNHVLHDNRFIGMMPCQRQSSKGQAKKSKTFFKALLDFLKPHIQR
jgi:hypothetical protein